MSREERLQELKTFLADTKTKLAVRQSEHDKRKKKIKSRFNVTSPAKIKDKLLVLQEKQEQFEARRDNLITKADGILEEFYEA